MKIRLDYHRDGLSINVPDRNLLAVAEAPACAAPGKPEEVVEQAVLAPIGASPLSELARERRSACVVIPDVTRPMPCRLALPPVLAAVENAGVPRDAILILIATGLHRLNVGAELEEMVGREIIRTCRIENHVARDRDSHSRGSPPVILSCPPSAAALRSCSRGSRCSP